jgi:hypothetical protein
LRRTAQQPEHDPYADQKTTENQETYFQKH